MMKILTLLLIGLFAAAFCTGRAARILDSRFPTIPLPVRLVLASLAAPAVATTLMGIAIIAVWNERTSNATVARNLPGFFSEVMAPVGLKLWAMGAICAIILAVFRSDRSRALRGRQILALIAVACAFVLLLPSAMEFWISTGTISWVFKIVLIVSAFFVGQLPICIIHLILIRTVGAASAGRFGSVVVFCYAILVAGVALLWSRVVAAQPGAAAVLIVEISAMIGVVIGWLMRRRSSEFLTRVVGAISGDRHGQEFGD